MAPYSSINTQAAEQTNKLLKAHRRTISYMTATNAILYLELVMRAMASAVIERIGRLLRSHRADGGAGDHAAPAAASGAAAFVAIAGAASAGGGGGDDDDDDDDEASTGGER